jgi:hypothetical protein
LETSLLNVPLVASNMGAIPEIVFWKVRFFNPFDENDLIKALKDAKNWNFEIIPAKNFDLCHTLVGLEKLYYEVWKGRGLKRGWKGQKSRVVGDARRLTRWYQKIGM